MSDAIFLVGNVFVATFKVAGNNKTYLGLRVKGPDAPIFLAYFNQFWNLVAHFRRNPQYQISQQSNS